MSARRETRRKLLGFLIFFCSLKHGTELWSAARPELVCPEMWLSDASMRNIRVSFWRRGRTSSAQTLKKCSHSVTLKNKTVQGGFKGFSKSCVPVSSCHFLLKKAKRRYRINKIRRFRLFLLKNVASRVYLANKSVLEINAAQAARGLLVEAYGNIWTP